MPLMSRNENGNWSLNRDIEVATKLRVEEQKGGRNLKRSPCQETEVATTLLIKDYKGCRNHSFRS